MARQLNVLALTVAMLASNGWICAGWAATPEARMACCEDEDTCPMHEGDAAGSGDAHAVTQVQADSCCATSEQKNSSQSSPTSVATISSAVLGTGVVLPVSAPARVLSDAWRTVVPIPIGPVPRHVLLSVFLV